MPIIRLAFGATLAAAALVLAGCGGGGGEAGGTETTATETTTTETTATETTPVAGAKLVGRIGSPDSPDAFVITLTTEDGAAVTTLAPGTYTLEVDDPSTIHNFHLTGPGVDVATDVGGTGTESFTVTLEAGSYHFQCDPHASTMNGDFQVSG